MTRGGGASGEVVTHWRVSEQQFLQEYIDEISADLRVPDESGNLSAFNRNRFRGGAVIHLQKGTYDVDLVINNPGVTIQADGANQTEIMGKVTVYAPFTQIRDLAIRGVNRPYALRVMRNPAPGYGNISRCRFENLVCGGSYWAPTNPQDPGAPGVPIDAPINGIEIDGVYLTDFKHVTSAFCHQNGWHIEATNILYPSTTLGFTDCSAVKNGKYGYYAKGPLNGFHVMRGNVEQNGIYGVAPGWNQNPDLTDLAEMFIESVTNTFLQNVDFEGNIPMDRIIRPVTSNIGLVEGCTFFYDASWNAGKPAPLRFIEGATCSNWIVRANRTQGFAAGRIAQFDDRGSMNEILAHGYGEDPPKHQHVKVFTTGYPLWNCYR